MGKKYIYKSLHPINFLILFFCFLGEIKSLLKVYFLRKLKYQYFRSLMVLCILPKSRLWLLVVKISRGFWNTRLTLCARAWRRTWKQHGNFMPHLWNVGFPGFGIRFLKRSLTSSGKSLTCENACLLLPRLLCAEIVLRGINKSTLGNIR